MRIQTAALLLFPLAALASPTLKAIPFGNRTPSQSLKAMNTEQNRIEASSVSGNSMFPNTIFKRAKIWPVTNDCGTFVMDCKTALGACNNACFYQNCVSQGQTVRYRDYRKKTSQLQTKLINSDNRRDAGTTISTGATCKVLPISQKMHDNFPDWSTKELETDEWPMAAMSQEDFEPGVIRNTLRCIPAKQNGNGGQQLQGFRAGYGNYDQKTGKYSSRRGCWAEKELSNEATYDVEFSLDGMTQNEIDIHVPYCKPNPDCTNDGRQFHLSVLELTAKKKSGRMGWPYDTATMNNYEMTGEGVPIEAYLVVVKLIGDEKVEAFVSTFHDGGWEELGHGASDKLDVGETLTVSGLPRDLKLRIESDENIYFEYGDPNDSNDRLALFVFNTLDQGFSKQFDNSAGLYCIRNVDTDMSTGEDTETWECVFPGW